MNIGDNNTYTYKDTGKNNSTIMSKDGEKDIVIEETQNGNLPKIHKEPEYATQQCVDDTKEGNGVESDNDKVDDVLLDNAKDEIKLNVTNNSYLLYDVSEKPPIYVTLVCAMQQAMMTISFQLLVALLVADVVCASNNDVFKAKLLSSTMFMSGFTTVAMNILGIRLPLFQGGTAVYVVPLIRMANIEGTFCSSSNTKTEDVFTTILTPNVTNTTGGYVMNQTEASNLEMDIILSNINSLQGPLILVGIIHGLIGATGFMGVLLRFVGPLTIVPTLILIFVFFAEPVLTYTEPSWPITISTIVVAVVLFLYLSRYNMPVPVWTPSGGLRFIRYPLHQVYAMLISMLINWLICGLLTNAGVFTDDPDNIQYKSRTDARVQVIQDNPWFSMTYPGQFGPIGFSGSAFVCFLCATLISILDSVGDYYACARVSQVPPPPAHAMNRGIMIEGLCTVLSGTVGVGHATTTYGNCVGSIGITRVASREVYLYAGIIYMLFGVFGKISAVFITIPYPVLGGTIIVSIAIFFGVVISNLEVTNMSSPRNIAILGLSVFIGLMVPTWVAKTKDPVQTGNERFDSIMGILLGNPNLVGTFIACFLDNTVPGTLEERGIAAWQNSNIDPGDQGPEQTQYREGLQVYNPIFYDKIKGWRITKYLPFIPKYNMDKEANVKREDNI